MFLSDSELQLLGDHDHLTRDAVALVQAAVAIIVRDTEQGSEILMMQRAHHANDPWSGQMSFPGGKIDHNDASAKEAAIREVEEEVGLRLRSEHYVGQLNDLYGLKVDDVFSVHVSCFVFKVDGDIALNPNHEVADLVWLPMAFLDSSENGFDYPIPKAPSKKVPAILISQDKDQILWGLSLRMLCMLFDVLGKRFAALSDSQWQQMHQIETESIKSSELDIDTKKFASRR